MTDILAQICLIVTAHIDYYTIKRQEGSGKVESGEEILVWLNNKIKMCRLVIKFKKMKERKPQHKHSRGTGCSE